MPPSQKPSHTPSRGGAAITTVAKSSRPTAAHAVTATAPPSEILKRPTFWSTTHRLPSESSAIERTARAGTSCLTVNWSRSMYPNAVGVAIHTRPELSGNTAPTASVGNPSTKICRELSEVRDPARARYEVNWPFAHFSTLFDVDSHRLPSAAARTPEARAFDNPSLSATADNPTST